jgi:hypothetical protein
MFTGAHYWPLSWARWIQSTSLHPLSLRSIVILFPHIFLYLPSGLFPSELDLKVCDNGIIMQLLCDWTLSIVLFFYLKQRFGDWSLWLRGGFELVNRFTGSSLVVTTISSITLKITVNITYVRSHTKSSNSSSSHTAVPLELRNSSEVYSHSRILSYPLGTDHSQKTQFHCCVAQTTQKSSHMMTISPIRWRVVVAKQRAINIRHIIACAYCAVLSNCCLAMCLHVTIHNSPTIVFFPWAKYIFQYFRLK